MNFKYDRMIRWPPLAWLANLRSGKPCITVQHGANVETRGDWFCEAVWPGSFASGDFDRADIVAGSGARIRDNQAIFVSAGATVDRLVSIQTSNGFYVSNSLPCLLANVGGSLDPSYRQYFADLNSIIDGIDKYRRLLKTSAGLVRLTYFDNLAWTGADLRPTAKPFPRRDFGSFARYRAFLSEGLKSLAANMAAAERKVQYRMLSTVSSGYDSPTVTTLAKEAGCTEAISIDKAMYGDDEPGAAIAAALGVRALEIKRTAWRTHDTPEPPFIVGDGLGQDLPFKGAERLLSGRVLLTGYHGGPVWQKAGGKHLNENIVRRDMSGLSLTEYRLSAGFIHCPVPFWGSRQVRELNALSNAPEMAPWDISGKPEGYSRPICRRIVEEAGVPRKLFGQRKHAAAVLSPELLIPSSMASYQQWLKQNRQAWLTRGRIPPLGAKLDAWLDEHAALLKRYLSRTPFLWRFAVDPPSPDITPSGFRRYIFPWAMEVQKARYRA